MERPDFVPLFREVIDHKDCTNLDAILYGYIYWLTKLKNERCIASTETLAELCKSTPGSIRVSLTTLERAGFILRKYENDNPRNSRLEIIPMLVFGKVLATANRGVSHSSHEVLATVAQNKSIEEEHTGEQVRAVYESDSDHPEKKTPVIPHPYSIENTRIAWQDGSVRLQLLDWYLSETGLWSKAATRAKLQAIMLRHSKAAERIERAGWTFGEVKKARSKIKENERLYGEWTLETVEKYLTK